jgi:hypothetical protein
MSDSETSARTFQPLDPEYADEIFAELTTLEVQLDSDPLIFGPKRLNGKIALSRKMSSRCERVFLDVSQKLSAYRRSLRTADLLLDLGKKHLLANDPHVRSGRAVSEREAFASEKLQDEVQAVADSQHAVEDLDAVLTVIKAKRSDLRDIQGRLRDQIRLCQEEIGLGSRWGSKSPRGTELEPGQGFADAADVAEVDDLIETVRAVSDAESHLSAEVDTSDPEEEQVADLATSADDAEAPQFESAGERNPVSAPISGAAVEFDFTGATEEASQTVTPGTDLVDEFGFVPHCEVCGEMQSKASRSGMNCPNGHGGADSVPPPEAEPLQANDAEEPPAAEVLPGSSGSDEIADFLAEPEEEPMSRREIEESDEDLDIESILSNFKG